MLASASPRQPRHALRCVPALLSLGVLILGAACSSETPFNVQNARAHVERLAGAIGSRAAATQANAEARAYLIETLQLYGFDVRVQEADAQWPEAGLTARVANIIAIRNGELQDAVALVAHYDSVTAGPGAGDDGFGVAVALESARVLAARESPRYSLMVLLTDGEEDGLMGARALVLDEEVRRRLRTYLNLEAVGTGRPVPLFESGPGTGPALRAWAQSPRPRGGSYMQSIYDALPNDTDFSVFRTLGVFGLNFAAVGDSYAYHTDRDRPDRVDPRALADMGAVAVDIVSRLDHGPLDASESSSVYFSLLDRTAFVLTVTAARVLGVLAVLLGLATWCLLALGSHRERGMLTVVMTFAWATIATGGVALALVGSVWLLRAARAELHPWYASPWRLFVFMTVMVVVVTWLVRRLAAVVPPRVRPMGTPSAVWLTTLPVWIVLAAASLVYAPAASYLATVPLLGATAVLLLAVVLPLGVWREPVIRGASVVVALGTWMMWAGDGWDLLEFSVSLLARLPVVTPVWAFPVLFLAIGVFLWPPVLAALVGRMTFRLRHGLAGSILMIAFVISALLVLLAAAYTPERPQRRAVAYVEDRVTGEAFWRLAGNEPGVDIAAGPDNMQWHPAAQDSSRAELPRGAFVFEATVDIGPLDVPARVTSSTTRHETGADIEVTIAAHDHDRLSAAFVLPPSVVPTSTTLLGRSMAGRWRAQHVNVPRAGLTWRASVPLSQADALAQAEVWLARPELPGAAPSSRLPVWLPDERTAWASMAVVKVGIEPEETLAPEADTLGESLYVPTPLARVHYYDAGSGDTALVFLHGWGGEAAHWREQVPLPRGRRALFVDLPGHGRSDATSGDYTIGAMADAVRVVLQSAGVTRAIIVGHGMGALVGWHVAVQAPDRVEGLVSVDGILLPTAADADATRSFIESVRTAGADTFVPGLLGPRFSDALPSHVRQQIVAQATNTPTNVLVSSMEDMAAGSGAPYTPGVLSQPMLALVARRAGMPSDHEAQLRERFPELDYRAFDGAGHYLMMERPQDVNDAIAGFILGRGLLR